MLSSFQDPPDHMYPHQLLASAKCTEKHVCKTEGSNEDHSNYRLVIAFWTYNQMMAIAHVITAKQINVELISQYFISVNPICDRTFNNFFPRI